MKKKKQKKKLYDAMFFVYFEGNSSKHYRSDTISVYNEKTLIVDFSKWIKEKSEELGFPTVIVNCNIIKI